MINSPIQRNSLKKNIFWIVVQIQLMNKKFLYVILFNFGITLTLKIEILILFIVSFLDMCKYKIYRMTYYDFCSCTHSVC